MWWKRSISCRLVSGLQAGAERRLDFFGNFKMEAEGWSSRKEKKAALLARVAHILMCSGHRLLLWIRRHKRTALKVLLMAGIKMQMIHGNPDFCGLMNTGLCPK
ncbi:hypothetical protein BGV40_01030 [Methanosarcina sp. Ant1]|nr:hypothetical protein BGV40_01030 [Methanosarcina sp. Ant1]